MRNWGFILFLGFVNFCWAQSTFNNVGNLYMHPQATVGIHNQLNNEGDFVAQPNTLLGFYGNTTVSITGNAPLNVYDAELANDFGLVLFTPLNISNNFNFITGTVFTPYNDVNVTANFFQDAFFTGESDSSYIQGFASVENEATFSFPVGDKGALRPLLLNAAAPVVQAKCTYIKDNPTNPAVLAISLDTNEAINDIGYVSDQEFWILDTNQPSQVTISWDFNSGLQGVAPTVDDIVLVGWSKAANQWVIIGNSAISGSPNEGFLVSNTFVPSNFEAITFGTTPLPTDTFATNYPTLGNYFVSPNGDGINDVLSFDDWDQIEGRNVLHIYNRFGQKVYTKENYLNNEFNGFSNLDKFVIKREEGLPDDIYYYTVSLPEMDLHYQGFFYLKR